MEFIYSLEEKKGKILSANVEKGEQKKKKGKKKKWTQSKVIFSMYETS